MHKLSISKHFSLLALTAITSSLIISKPGLAATFASSEAGLMFNNFSIHPKDIKTFTDTDTQTVSLSSQGQVNADADAIANFTSFENLPQSFANNFSKSIASGQGKDYFGIAESFASVTGLNFQVAPESNFSFDFMGFLNLKASVDNPDTEYAGSDGLISLQLYDQDNGTLLDSLTIQGNTIASNNSDFLIANKTDNFSFSPTDTSFDTKFNSINEYANASIKGNYSRKFTTATNLSLLEFKSNRARVVVPEPTSQLALVFGAVSILLISKAKRKFIQNKANN